MIRHWVHLRCAGIHQSQYTDTWTWNPHRGSRLTQTEHHPTFLDNVQSPLPIPHIHNPHHLKQNTDTRPTLSGLQTYKLLSTHPFKPFPRRFPDPSQFAAAKLTHYCNKDATTLGLLTIMATHPALMRCTPEPWHYYKVSMSGVCSQCYKSWGELFMQSLFWMGTFEVFWSSKRSRV